MQKAPGTFRVCQQCCPVIHQADVAGRENFIIDEKGLYKQCIMQTREQMEILVELSGSNTWT